MSNDTLTSKEPESMLVHDTDNTFDMIEILEQTRFYFAHQSWH